MDALISILSLIVLFIIMALILPLINPYNTSKYHLDDLCELIGILKERWRKNRN